MAGRRSPIRTIQLLALAWLLGSGIAMASDRSVAEWTLRVGGSVVIEGDTAPIRDLDNLPAKPFYLQSIDLIESVFEPDELKRLIGLTRVKALYLSGRTWHGRPVKMTDDSLAAIGSLVSLEKLALSLPVQTEIPLQDPGLTNLAK